MSAHLNGFGPEYLSALEAYLRARDEGGLSYAYELGRKAMVDGLGVLDMAMLHRAALEALVVSAPTAERARSAKAAADFFAELLSPFEMSFQGYRAANEELRRVNESLRQQKDALDAANRELEAFSYSVSHDLRTPLRSIDGFSQVLIEDCADALDETGRKYLRYIREGAQQMAQLIDDLLSLARVTRSELDCADVDLTAIAQRIAQRLQAASPDRNVHFAIQEGVRGKGDARLLAVLLENLLGNAWKFTNKRERAEITFGCEEGEARTTYFIRDNGAGFDMAYADKLFGTFQRLHSASEFEGTGIGLAIVQRAVRRHDGRVWAEGKVDGGATFFFTLGARQS
jgi:light-regulated signal transduction histidine kinase (bacteriophytochrome)